MGMSTLLFTNIEIKRINPCIEKKKLAQPTQPWVRQYSFPGHKPIMDGKAIKSSAQEE